jgi:hypothetical protein
MPEYEYEHIVSALEDAPPPPPPRRSYLPEPTWGTSTSSHTLMFSPEVLGAAHEAWVNVLKGVMPNCSEF